MRLRIISGALALVLLLPECNFAQSRMALQERLLHSGEGSSSSGEKTVSRKSPMLAAVASLAVPGLGELYAGRYDVGKYSTVAEASLWIFYAVLEIHSNLLRNDAIGFAKIYAGADMSGKSGQFLVDMGNFNNTEDYNTKKIHDDDFGAIYTLQSYQWQWQSDADRERFKDIRIKADQLLDYGRYTVGVIILNHVISAISAARLTSVVNASASTSLGSAPGTSGLYLNLSKSF